MNRLILISFINLLLTNLFSQSVNVDSIWINGNIPRMTNLSLIQKSAIKIDSIIKDTDTMDSLYADSLVYVGKSSFAYYAKDKICIVNTIIFDNKIDQLTLGKHKITKTTSRSVLRGMFPLDCNETKPIKVFGEKGRFECCSIPIKDSQGNLWDMRIVFFFQNDKLVRIDFWEPS
jgi:hypothetical protein